MAAAAAAVDDAADLQARIARLSGRIETFLDEREEERRSDEQRRAQERREAERREADRSTALLRAAQRAAERAAREVAQQERELEGVRAARAEIEAASAREKRRRAREAPQPPPVVPMTIEELAATIVVGSPRRPQTERVVTARRGSPRRELSPRREREVVVRPKPKRTSRPRTAKAAAEQPTVRARPGLFAPPELPPVPAPRPDPPRPRRPRSALRSSLARAVAAGNRVARAAGGAPGEAAVGRRARQQQAATPPTRLSQRRAREQLVRTLGERAALVAERLQQSAARVAVAGAADENPWEPLPDDAPERAQRSLLSFLQEVYRHEQTLPPERAQAGASCQAVAALPRQTLAKDCDEPCCICLDAMAAGASTVALPQCLHMFHESCIVQWLGVGDFCPLCKTQVG